MPGGLTGYGPPQLPGQLETVSVLLKQVVNGLAMINDTLKSAGNKVEDQIITENFSTGMSYVTPVQLRITALIVYTTDAGLFRVKIGEDNSLAFLSTVNGRVVPIDGESQLVVVPRGLPITIIPPSGSWYATLCARAGAVYGRQA